MEAIEFEAVVENRTISIPKQYLLDTKKVRVVLFTETSNLAVPKNKLMDIVNSAKGKGCFKSAKEVDTFIRNERNKWD